MANPNDLIAEAQKRGLVITSQGINMDALAGFSKTTEPVLDRAPASVLWFKAFVEMCEAAKSEAAFQDLVAMLAHRQNWRVIHIRKVLVKMGEKTHYETPFDLDGAGSFDLDFYRERLVKAELKFGKNKPQDNQLAWKAHYDAAGVENYIWYPKDAEQIIEVLTCHRPATR